MQAELTTLKHIFEKQYRFTTEQWDIPGRDSTKATRALQKKLFNFQDSHQCEDELLIVYYGGHGEPDRRGRSIWAAYIIFSVCRPDLLTDFRNKKPDSPTLNWSLLQHLLETAIPHVLIILDCCHAANAARDTSDGTNGTTKELLAACGREHPTIGNSDRSFTTALIEELRVFGNKPFTVAMLHSRLITIRWRLASTPVYALLSEHGGHSIELAPQPRPTELPDSPKPLDPEMSDGVKGISSPGASIASDTRVLLAVSITDDAICNIVEWKKWLVSQAPWDVTKIEVKVEAVFKSHSTMLITSIPTVAWDLLPNKAAYRFIGFVTSSNLSQEPLCCNDASQESGLIVSKQEQKLVSVKARLDMATQTAATNIVQENHVITDARADSRDKLETLESNVRVQEEEIKVIRETLELRKQHWGNEKRGLEQKLHLAEERLKIVQGPFAPEVKSDIVLKDSSKLGTEAELKPSPTENSSPQESDTSYAGSTKAQELANSQSHKFTVADMEPFVEPNPLQQRANPVPLTSDVSPGVVDEQRFQAECDLRTVSGSSFGIYQPASLYVNAPNAATPEDAAQTNILLSDRKRPYVGTGLFRPELPKEAPGASLHQAGEDFVIKCICGFHDDDGSTVFCDGCDTWQHTDCYYFDVREFEDIEHLCVECNPREFDIDVARDRQLIRRASQHQVLGNKRRKTSPRKAPRRSPGVLSTDKEPAKISFSHEGPLAEVSGTTDPTSEVIYAPTTHSTRKAKKGKRVHICSKPGCGKVCCRSPRVGHSI